jgi:uncharacterized membrane protein YgaE (UPF0421/DUF939 family)
MAEIKSTLDLIMEKTKNLTMSDEEKRAFKKKELAGKVRTLVQRTLDGLITEERFEEEVSNLRLESGNESLLKRTLLEELIGRFDLGQEHEPLVNLLNRSIKADKESLHSILRKAEEEARSLREERREILRKRLEKRGIAGSAVTANPGADTEFKEAMRERQQALRADLKRCAEASTAEEE